MGISLPPGNAAVKGHIDFSDHSIQTGQNATLDGYWEFYWKQFLTPSDFQGTKRPEKSGYIKLPGPWNLVTLKGKKLSPLGYATFRTVLHLHKDDINSLVSLDMPFVHSAYSLWINGRIVASNGQPGTSRNEMIPFQVPRIVTFYTHSTEIEVILHISNFHQRSGGIQKHIRIGNAARMNRNRDIRLAILLLAIGCIIIIAIFHFSTAIFRPEDTSNLYFGAFSLTLVLRLLLTSEKLLVRFIPELPWALCFRLEYLTITSTLIFFMLFIQSRHKEEISPRPVKIIITIQLILSAFAVFAPVLMVSKNLMIFTIVLVCAIIYILYSIIKIAWKDRKWAPLYILGVVAFFGAIINDILVSQRPVQGIYIFSIGFLIFVITQSIISLQQSIEEQNRLVILDKELEISGKLQRSILPASIPEIPGIDFQIRYLPAHDIGGDFYHFHVTDNNKVGIILADVTGHGIPASLIASMVKIAFSQQEQYSTSPALLLVKMNEVLFKQVGGQYVTALYMHIDLETRKLKIARAGHLPAILLRGEEIKELWSEGRLLGSFPEINCNEIEVDLQSKDRILLYTDGITERRQNEQFMGTAGLISILEQANNRDAAGMADEIILKTSEWPTAEKNHDDDTTLILLEIA